MCSQIVAVLASRTACSSGDSGDARQCVPSARDGAPAAENSSDPEFCGSEPHILLTSGYLFAETLFSPVWRIFTQLQAMHSAQSSPRPSSVRSGASITVS